MKKQTKQALSLLLAGVMLMGALSGCTKKDPAPSGSANPSGSTPATGSYPMDVEELGSGTVKWTETTTKDGWNKVVNDGGTTLGYSPESGISLIQVDGFAFKDLNKNGKLDGYEDWRQDDAVRSADIAAQLTVDDVAGLMLFSAHQFSVSPELSDDQMTFLEQGVRAVLSAASASPTGDQAAWNNTMQAYVEGMGLGIPVNISTDPRSSGVSTWPGNLALSATFDPEIALEQGKQLSKEYRALGIGTLLGPQIDVATEPRWPRTSGTFSEDPALSRDMTEAATSGYQSTYDDSGNDLGWGAESVNAMIKHWVSEGASEGGREAHAFTGQYAVYPGGQFETGLIPFVDGGFNLTHSSTGSATAVMSSYTIAYSDDEEYGELVGSGFSEYKLQLLRSYGFDGVICTDWAVLGMESMGMMMDTGWGVQDLSQGERAYKALVAGVDQFGGLNDPAPVMEAYEMMIDEMGEDAALARFQESGARLLKNYFTVGLFDNSYVDVAYAKETVGSKEAQAAGYDAQLKGIVMLKNDGAIAENTSSEKPTVYVPLVYTAASASTFGATAAGAALPVDRKTLSEYYKVVTDTVSETLTGPADADGNPTVAYEDIIRATPAELADCDYALVFVKSPAIAMDFTGIGYDFENKNYIPLSLQYRPYTANSSGVRAESIAGPMVETEVESVYGVQKVMAPANASYLGKSTTTKNERDLDTILYATANMPDSAKVIVAINASNAMVMSEFEDQVDGIIMGFGVNNAVFLDIASGKVEPSGLLPIQMPADMDTVEANFEDVPRDLICYEDAQGNVYDFAFGMNWSGVISDARTAKYGVEPLVSPVAQPVK